MRGAVMGYRGGLNVTQVNPKRGADIFRAAAQSIPNNVATTIVFLSEEEDTTDYYAVGASSIVIPTGLAGFYVIAAQGVFVANATGTREVSILRNGVVIAGSASDNAGAGSSWIGGASVGFALVVGDTITVTMFQDSGAALDTGTCRLQAYRVAA